jgi:hypothetical protein
VCWPSGPPRVLSGRLRCWRPRHQATREPEQPSRVRAPSVMASHGSELDTRALSVRAHAAAREVTVPPAVAAARAAGHAGAVAHRHPALRASAYSAKASGLAASEVAPAAVASAVNWAVASASLAVLGRPSAAPAADPGRGQVRRAGLPPDRGLADRCRSQRTVRPAWLMHR